MALVNFSRFATKIANKNSLGVIIRTATHWNKDFKPGPYPKTQAEREAAAKRYGIPIEQYEPYPDDGMGYGDYPKLPDISVDRKCPHYPYDFPDSKRNFGDPIHADSDLYSEDRYNNSPPRYSVRFMWFFFLGLMASCFVLFFWLEDYKTFRPVLKKQYPEKGRVHYTFEAAN